MSCGVIADGTPSVTGRPSRRTPPAIQLHMYQGQFRFSRSRTCRRDASHVFFVLLKGIRLGACNSKWAFSRKKDTFTLGNAQSNASSKADSGRMMP
ncbi:hypothetical protein EVAR_94404_1 [Eumeta japonica]|uniref:Uncharacterized protein n=1 Tax=Eumeta variegata TaxID=151549 RepID=A0A4C1TQ34_EUMVA|nr:hypothetical protein EVAR_94404_1 [Eumeta japonica]